MAITAAEQYAIELLNRARLDPAGEARRHGMALNEGLPSGWHISSAAKQVLAPNQALEQAAARHGEWLRVRDFRLDRDDNDDGIADAHYEAGNSNYFDPGDRMKMAGYRFEGSNGWGENLASSSTMSNAISTHHSGWMHSPSHRYNMLSERFTEIGFAQVTGEYLGYNNSSLAVQNFAYSGSRTFVTGVAYTDRNNNNFYSIGEGRSGLSMKIIGGDDVKTQSAGGYALQAKWGQEVTVEIGGGTRAKVDLDKGNVKLDVVNNALLKVSGDVELLSGPIKHMQALGVGAIDLTGNDLGNRLTGSAGRNDLSGGGGSDTLGGAGGNDTLRGGDGADILGGSDGNDRLNGNAGADQLSGGKGADVFLFENASGADVVTDFTMGQGDRLALAESLWGGGLTDRQVIARYAEVVGGNVLFDFGDGDTLLLQGVRSLNGLADRIDFL
jgi:Ca2+-binding RTX toxin-like protein